MLSSLFALFAIELWMNHKTGGHSHGGATGDSVDQSHQKNNSILSSEESRVGTAETRNDFDGKTIYEEPFVLRNHDEI